MCTWVLLQLRKFWDSHAPWYRRLSLSSLYLLWFLYRFIIWECFLHRNCFYFFLFSIRLIVRHLVKWRLENCFSIRILLWSVYSLSLLLSFLLLLPYYSWYWWIWLLQRTILCKFYVYLINYYRFIIVWIFILFIGV